jgi:hypothetical protein
MQLIGSATYYVPFTPTAKDGDGTAIANPKDFDEYFPDRAGLGYSCGLRFMF